ncbi:hypothetical protein MHTCC0001_28400 [Flavobacteriaceae bacterium MHTCC 0001]
MMKKLSILLAIALLIFTSCSKDDDTKSEGASQNKLIVNGTEYKISKVMSYFEANGNTPDYYYFDLAFLTEGMDFSFTSETTFVNGTGTILAFTLISETAPIKNGDYLHTKSAVNLTPFYAYEPHVIIDKTLNNQDWYDDFDASLEDIYEDTFSSAAINVVVNGNEYTITGSGMFNNVSFSIAYKGEIAFDPESEGI